MATKRTAIDQVEFMRNLLAFLLVGAFISVLPVFTFFVIPETNKDVITYMIGQLSGMATTTLGFYFVSKVGQDALDAKRAENTAEAFKAVTSVAEASKMPGEGAVEAAQVTADAAQDKADEVADNGGTGRERPFA